MSDFMLLGILRMPIEADGGVVAFTQFRSAARSAADRIEQLTAEREALEQDNHRWKMECENFWRDREKTLTAERDRLTAQLESTLKDRALIIAERDRTFALMLARAEAAEADAARLREALILLIEAKDEEAPFGGEIYRDRMERLWSRAWSTTRAALKGETP